MFVFLTLPCLFSQFFFCIYSAEALTGEEKFKVGTGQGYSIHPLRVCTLARVLTLRLCVAAAVIVVALDLLAVCIVRMYGIYYAVCSNRKNSSNGMGVLTQSKLLL